VVVNHTPLRRRAARGGSALKTFRAPPARRNIVSRSRSPPRSAEDYPTNSRAAAPRLPQIRPDALFPSRAGKRRKRGNIWRVPRSMFESPNGAQKQPLINDSKNLSRLSSSALPRGGFWSFLLEDCSFSGALHLGISFPFVRPAADRLSPCGQYSWPC